ncbi:OmpA family protein [Parapedobacter luteus]|uniref:OmpA family protein n=1 Tax=Parapedobacter luteus TaxID=623280 RepID=A0A1T5EDK0_9SPHI|nr:OmpA family protein [Parapedobacter luteus]SKB81991.1 OmpA family protein [Parapedobacter luteus]
MKCLQRTTAAIAAAIGIVFGIMPLPIQAQSILNKIKNRAEQTATQKVLNETDKAVSKGMDKAIESATTKPDGDTPETDGASAAPGPDTAANKQTAIHAFSRYDFVPGDSVLYANDFSGEAIGELPTGWNSNGSSVVVSLDGLPGQWLRMAQRTVVLTDNEQAFGPDFTVEFDMVLQIDFKGWLPPSFKLGLLASGAESTTANKLLSDPKGDKSFYLEISPLSDAANLMLESYEKYTRHFYSPPNKNKVARSWYGKSSHVAIQVQKERLRLWVDGEKLYDVPKGIPKDGQLNQLFFQLGSSPYEDEQIGVYVGNIKIARGLPDTRHKLVEEGRFSTTGILFDTGSATIKPESAGVLKSIAAVLTQHPDIRVHIVGHTDAVGDDAANQALSERRAAAVKEALQAQHQIDGARLEASGKGEVEPVADNQTAAGRAQNRRVEFIKL